MKEVPREWLDGILGDWIKPRGEKIMPRDNHSLRFIGMDNVEAHTTKILGTVHAGTMKSSAAHFYPGDVLYGRLRPYLNKVVRPDFEGLASAEFIVFPSGKILISSFLKYRLNSADFVSFANHLNEGDRPRVSFDQINKFYFPLPHPKEQEHIVELLEELLSDLDNAIENLKKVQEQLKIYRLAVLKYAFEGRFTRATFEEASIEKIALSVTYGTSNKAEKSGAIPVLRMGDIKNGKIDYSNLKFYRNLDDLENLLLESGDLLFNRTNSAELVGKTGIFTGHSQYKQVTFASYLIRIRVDQKKVIPAYLNYWMNSPEALLIKNRLKNQQVGQANINGTKLKSIKFPLAIDIKKQKSIVEEIESRFSVCDQLEQTIELNLLKAESLRQSILKQAFEGKLTERWRKGHKSLISGENSAEALLKKIMAEKAALNGKAKRIKNHD